METVSIWCTLFWCLFALIAGLCIGFLVGSDDGDLD